MSNEKLDQPISSIYKITTRTKNALSRLGIETVNDLLFHLPNRYEDRTRLLPISQLPFDEPVVVNATIGKTSSRYTQTGRLMITIPLTDESGSINGVMFNQRYLLKMFKKGDKVLIFGRKKFAKSMNNPLFIQKVISKTELTPIYATTKSLSQYMIRKLIDKGREQIASLKSILPEELASRYHLSTKAKAVTRAHYPIYMQDLSRARLELGVEEMVLMMLSGLAIKKHRQGEKRRPTKAPVEQIKQLLSTLPYQLTPSQKKCAWQILGDMDREYPMSRLLYGEVGSGKTIVGVLACLSSIKAGHKAIWLSPTTALSEQHYQNISRLLAPLGVKVSQTTASYKHCADSDLIIATHAILRDQLDLSQIDLVIIDEQHRFGVKQRNYLIDRFPQAHILMMSATPIPRSLAQIFLSHLDVSQLTDKPTHQKTIETILLDSKKRSSISRLVAERLDRGEPGYVICPLIEAVDEDEVALISDDDRKSVKSEYDKLTKEFPKARIAMLHGRLKEKEKTSILANFRAGKIDILLSTTVIEVGIDNPDATWILIENADRFGLAQLHQLRGRVGRGAKESICILSASPANPLAWQRLEYLRQASNGLELAEADLKMRGPGEIVGFEQSGLPKLKFANILDKELMTMAKSIVDEIADDFTQYPALDTAVKRYILDVGDDREFVA